uniref:Extended synaptotagmin-like protein 2 n=1 Tax=Iconisemion striatum TaxID=60296 RepID=A0A1A7YPU8_9TELE
MSNKMDGSAGPGTRANGQAGASSSPPPSPSPPSSPAVTSEEPQEEQQSSLSDVIQMWIKFAKTFAVIFPIYVLGYFEFSFSWILIGLAGLFYWRKNYANRDFRINRALAYLDHDDTAVKQNVPTTELPPWVHYPDVERVEWLNKTVKQMWPFICQFVDKLFRETIEPAVQGANAHLSTFSFTKIDMGDKPLRVNGVKVYTENIDKRQSNPLEFNPPGLKKASVRKAIKSGKKVTSEPSPFVQFTVGHKTSMSKTKYKTNEPLWEETFTFLIHNPKIQDLEIEVKDEKHECSLGTITLPLSRLLEAENMTLSQRFPIKNSGPNCTLKMKMALRVLHLGKDTSVPPNSTPSSVQVRKSSSSNAPPQPSVSSESPRPPSTVSEVPRSTPAPAQDKLNRKKEAEEFVKSPGISDQTQRGGGKEGGAAGGMGGQSLAETGRSTSNLNILGSQLYLAGGKESTPSIASDISNPYAAQELQQRLQQLQNGSGPGHLPLGEIQLTLRHSSQRNKLIVVVHSCRNLIAFTDHGSDPYVRLYLLPDKRRSGRRKTSTIKKTLNPVYDTTFEFNVPIMELQRRTLDVAVKNGGSLLSKNKGLLGKVLVNLTHDDITKGWTSWFDLSEDGQPKLLQV